jgi:hypothetical protein
MEPLLPRYSNMSLSGESGVPLTLAGQALEDAKAVESAVTGWDNQPVQLQKVKVRVEHVFRGQLNEKTLDIYYFKHIGAVGGSAMPVTVKKGMSALFFLQPDRNIWRSVCEGWSTCIIRISTGTHYGGFQSKGVSVEEAGGDLQRAIELTLEQNCVDFMMSRGDSTTDDQMLDVIEAPPGPWGWDLVLRRTLQVAKEDPSPKVRLAAQKKAEELQSKYRARLRPQ